MEGASMISKRIDRPTRRIPTGVSLLVAVLFWLGLPAAPAAAPSPGTPERISVLVHLTPGADRRPLRSFARGRGAWVHYEYEILPNVINLRGIPRPALDALLAQVPGVRAVEEDLEVHAHLTDSTPLIRALESQVLGAGFSADGGGVRVCVLDTGIDTDHIMYSSRIDFGAGRDFVNGDSDPEDDNGHGAHVSGIAVGATGLSFNFGCDGAEPFQGVAPEATLIGVKVLNAFGSGSFSDVIAGIDHCADQSPSGGRADVINMSLGGGAFTGACDGDSAASAANSAVDAGVVVVVSSGNDAFANSMETPACASKAIAVGATYDASYPNCEESTQTFSFSNCFDSQPAVEDLVCFTNRSDEIDVVAPGCKIYSSYTSPGGLGITPKCGTSMSAPHVAGLAALIRSADGTLTPAEVRQIIRDGAIDFGPAGFDRGYGHGRIDVLNSLALVTPCSVDGDCDDGLFCTGVETCIGGACQAGPDPCPGQDCLEGTGCVPIVCNDNGACESGENCVSCPGDCFSGTGAECGDGVCEAGDGEDCLSCAQDCNGKQNGKPSNRYCCGDGAGENAVPCSDGRCDDGGRSCMDQPAVPSCCGDGTCEGSESSFTCDVDCGPPPLCGDGNCDPGEDSCSCATDCGPDPGCSCLPSGSPCDSNGDCCSDKCKGKSGSKTCR
jgi:subtilisin family serine protease